METTGYRAGFSDMVDSIERHVRILSNPFFGDLQDNSGNTTLNRSKSQPSGKTRGNVVASTVSALDVRKEGRYPHAFKENEDDHCVCCSIDHTLENCKQFERKGHKKRMSLLKKRGVCFGCLQRGHLSCDCAARLQCEICKQNHPTVLHINRQTTAPECEPVNKLEELLMNQYNHDFCERNIEKQEMSIEDQRFLRIMETSARLQDGKYTLKLPFKKGDVHLPNNFAEVQQRLQG